MVDLSNPETRLTLRSVGGLIALIALVVMGSFMIQTSIMGADVALAPEVLTMAGILAVPGFSIAGVIAWRIIQPALRTYHALRAGETIGNDELLRAARAIRRFPAMLALVAVFWSAVPVPIAFWILHTWYDLHWIFGASFILVGVGTSLILGVTLFHFSKSIERNRVRDVLSAELARRSLAADGLTISQRVKVSLPLIAIASFLVMPAFLLGRMHIERVQVAAFRSLAAPLMAHIAARIEAVPESDRPALLTQVAQEWERPIHRVAADGSPTGSGAPLTPLLNDKLRQALANGAPHDALIDTDEATAVYYHRLTDGGAVLVQTTWTDAVADFWSRASLLAVGALLFLGFMTFYISSDVFSPLRSLLANIRRVQAGTITRSPPLITEDEYAEVSVAFGEMTQALAGHLHTTSSLAENLRGGVGLLGRSTERIAGISEDQSTGATQQAAAVRELLSTTEEIAATAQLIADRILGVRTVAEETLTACKHGIGTLQDARGVMDTASGFMADIAARMKRLEERSQRIDDVIKLIEDVAETTDLLSLNASLEAAGAHQEGKRFSVVAAEIRRLAERTTESANEVKTLVADIQREVGEAFEATRGLVGQVADSLNGLTAAESAFSTVTALAQETHQATDSIVTSTREQTTASAQLARTVAEINDVAEEVQRGARKLTESMMELSDLATSLRQIAGGDGQTAVPPTMQ